MARRAGLVVLVAGSAVLAWIGLRVWMAWEQVQRVEFQPGLAREVLASPDNPMLGSTTTIPYHEDEEPDNLPTAGEVTDTPDAFAAATSSGSAEAMDVYLVLGSDQRDYLGSSRRADTIMLFILPADGSTPVLISIPRDLYLPNPCTGGMSRVNANLNGCGSYATGPEQVAIAVEDFTGLTIDHFVLFTFDGFRNVIDRVGGVEICTDFAVRDFGVDPVPLDLPAGCTLAGGDQALAWVRSRHTEGFIDGEWVSVASSDLVRNRRQQDMVLQALQRVAAMSDISELAALVELLADDFVVDATLGLPEAIARAWNLRSLDVAAIARPAIPVADYIDPDGRWVLVPRATFESVVVAANPALAPLFAQPA